MFDVTSFLYGVLLGLILGIVGVVMWRALIAKGTDSQLKTHQVLFGAEGEKIATALADVKKLMNDLEKDREGKFRALATQLEGHAQKATDIAVATDRLNKILGSAQRRGAFGQRMAEDVLSYAGLEENLHYRKEVSPDGIDGRPDYTFLLPHGRELNMDVKFPLDNYQAYCEAEDEQLREKYVKDFLKDVRERARELTKREYINPQQNTLDMVLMMLPTEHMYSLVHRLDSSILDEALKKKIIVCSPITLMAILSMVRQAFDNFTMENTSRDILLVLEQFNKEWINFKESFAMMGKKLDDAQDTYERLTTTRTKKLDASLSKIDSLKRKHGIQANEGRIDISREGE